MEIETPVLKLIENNYVKASAIKLSSFNTWICKGFVSQYFEKLPKIISLVISTIPDKDALEVRLYWKEGYDEFPLSWGTPSIRLRPDRDSWIEHYSSFNKSMAHIAYKFFNKGYKTVYVTLYEHF